MMSYMSFAVEITVGAGCTNGLDVIIIQHNLIW